MIVCHILIKVIPDRMLITHWTYQTFKTNHLRLSFHWDVIVHLYTATDHEICIRDFRNVSTYVEALNKIKTIYFSRGFNEVVSFQGPQSFFRDLPGVVLPDRFFSNQIQELHVEEGFPKQRFLPKIIWRTRK